MKCNNQQKLIILYQQNSKNLVCVEPFGCEIQVESRCGQPSVKNAELPVSFGSFHAILGLFLDIP